MYKNFTIFIVIARFLENLFQGLAVITLIYLMLFILYMLFVLGNSTAFDFFAPLAKIVITIADTIIIFNVGAGTKIYEFVTGALLMISTFLICQLLKDRFGLLAKKLSELKEECRRSEDRRINQQLHRDIEKMNKQFSECFVYYEVRKKDHVYQEVNIDEQYKLLNQFLYSKTTIIPEKHGDGYLLKFPNIEKIDTALQYVFKAINSTAPIDYLFILQVIESSTDEALQEISKLKNAKLFNKIIMTPATNLRYEHNMLKAYSTSITGNFVFAGETHSIFEIRDKFLE